MISLFLCMSVFLSDSGGPLVISCAMLLKIDIFTFLGSEKSIECNHICFHFFFYRKHALNRQNPTWPPSNSEKSILTLHIRDWYHWKEDKRTSNVLFKIIRYLYPLKSYGGNNKTRHECFLLLLTSLKLKVIATFCVNSWPSCFCHNFV